MLRNDKMLHCSSKSKEVCFFFNNERMSDKAFFLLKPIVGL